MPSRLPKILIRIHELTLNRQLRFTLKALREVAELGLRLDTTAVCDILARLTPADSAGRLHSTVRDEWLYIFKPHVASTILYVKVVLRTNCLIVSFHENEDADNDANA
ncbi:MAG TPA: type II toxin-antitoxin system MqsR family toxin [Candidatus Baltobacteraceae bacterium]|nr:type II toxin-antitoxin system MqsR family toxin [Candidatus Baltobacteraceae bacterium]